MRSNARSWLKVTFMERRSRAGPCARFTVVVMIGAFYHCARKKTTFPNHCQLLRLRIRRDQKEAARRRDAAAPGMTCRIALGRSRGSLMPSNAATLAASRGRAGFRSTPAAGACVDRPARSRHHRAPQRRARGGGGARIRQHDDTHLLQLVVADGRRRGVAPVPDHACLHGRRHRLWRGQFIAITVLADRAPRAWSEAFKAFSEWIVIIVSVLIGGYSIPLLISNAEEKTIILGIGYVWMTLPITAGCALFVVRAGLRAAAAQLAGRRARDRGGLVGGAGPARRLAVPVDARARALCRPHGDVRAPDRARGCRWDSCLRPSASSASRRRDPAT